MSPSDQDSRRESIVIALATVIAAVLRLWGFPRLGLQHFDEGIYAQVGLWPLLLPTGGLGDVASLLVPYAPPGFPILIGAAYSLLGAVDRAAILVSILAGIATIPVAGGIARKTFGPGAGAMAAILAALSGPHVAFSRMALTDATFLLAWMSALALGIWFLERPRAGRAYLFGIAVGLAQNVKYNGWLIGAIVGLAALLEGRNGAKRRLGWLGFAAIVALLVYLPWFAFVQTHGGYDRLVAHHRGYFYGTNGWTARLWLQLAEQEALAGRLGSWPFGWELIAGLLGAFALAIFSKHLGRGVSWPARLITLCYVVFVGVMLSVLPSWPWWLGLAFLPLLLRDPRPGARVLACCWLVLSLLTPMYHPYARLWLPLTGLGWILLAGGWSGMVRHIDLGCRYWLEHRRPLIESGVLVFMGGLIAAGAWQWSSGIERRIHPGLLDRTDAQRVALPAMLSESPTGPLLVFGRPTIRFYLATRSNRPFQAAASFDQMLESRAPLVLLDEAMLLQEADPSAARSRVFDRFEAIPGASWIETLSPPTWLDITPDAAYGRDRISRDVHWRLIRPRLDR